MQLFSMSKGCLLGLAAAVAVAAAAVPPPGCDAEHRAVALIRLTGGKVLDASPTVSQDACKQRCCANALCVGWTAAPFNATTTPAGHGVPGSHCTLRSGGTVPTKDFDAVTGWVARASTGTDIPDTYGAVESLGGVAAAERQWSGCEFGSRRHDFSNKHLCHPLSPALSGRRH